MSLLKEQLDYMIKEKDSINKRNNLPIQDATKIHVLYTNDAYYVPNDISEWIPKRKNIILTAKWFKYKGIDYLYLITGLDGNAFYFHNGDDKDVMFKTEALYRIASGRNEEVIRGEKINILRLENNMLIIGVRNDGYEGSNGKVISLDGKKSSLICDWGHGL